jgi:hypothetical protein
LYGRGSVRGVVLKPEAEVSYKNVCKREKMRKKFIADCFDSLGYCGLSISIIPENNFSIYIFS